MGEFYKRYQIEANETESNPMSLIEEYINGQEWSVEAVDGHER